jgi:two-component system sensor histidine kinase UhpB
MTASELDALRLCEALVESINGIVCEMDAQTFVITFVNRHAERILGYPREQWLSQRDFWAVHTHPDDVGRATKEKLATIATGEPRALEYRMIAADGRVVWLSDVISVGRTDGDRVVLRGVKVDITARKEAEQALAVSNQRLAALTARLNVAREEEAARISRELHDELGSRLTALKWDIADMCQPTPSRCEVVLERIDGTIEVVRRIASELRPTILDDLGVIEAIESQCQQFTTDTGVTCYFEPHRRELSFSRDIESVIFRVVQEALTNVRRHANASRVTISLAREGKHAVLRIADNGRGSAVYQQTGLRSRGLTGMRDRVRIVGGDLDINGAPGQGTTITARLPVDH